MRARHSLPQAFHGIDSAHTGQVVVEQYHVGLDLGGQTQRLADIARFAGDFQIGIFAEQG